MIRYDLRCDAGHGFDAWFRSSSDFDAQSGRGLLGCPACGSAKIEKALMAPAISAGRVKTEAAPAEAAPPEATADAAPVALLSEKEQKLRGMLREIRQQLTANSENVGDRFPEVARKMHAEEIEQRSIHGKATPEEAKALADEGIEVHALPGFPDERD